jgi:hypothetical protein
MSLSTPPPSSSSSGASPLSTSPSMPDSNTTPSAAISSDSSAIEAAGVTAFLLTAPGSPSAAVFDDFLSGPAAGSSMSSSSLGTTGAGSSGTENTLPLSPLVPNVAAPPDSFGGRDLLFSCHFAFCCVEHPPFKTSLSFYVLNFPPLSRAGDALS